MGILEYLLDNTPRLAARPEPFGAFHVISAAVVVLLAVAMILFRRHLPRGERALRRFMIVFGVGLLLLEIGKQIVYSYDPVTGWAYNWDRFPFQFCSIPIYAALVAMCLRDCAVRRALLAFLATYSPVAGCAVLFYPSSDVFHEIIFLDVHTMVWHGAMLLFGLYLWLSEAVLPTKRTAFTSFLVYLPAGFIALALNEAEHAWGFAGEYTFNMFYISRYGTCLIPVLSDIKEFAPYPVFFASYVLVLGIGGLAVTAGVWVVRQVAEAVRRRGEG